jgi:hypothetical protein
MFGKIAGAWLGSRVAGRNSGFKGALLGAGVAAIARRGFFPLALAAGAAYGAKKLWDRNKRREPHYPSDAAPSPPSG